MSVPSCSTELKVVLAGIVIVLGWVFAIMLPSENGTKQTAFRSSDLSKNLSKTPKEGAETFCCDGCENFGYLSDFQENQSPYTLFSFLNRKKNSSNDHHSSIVQEGEKAEESEKVKKPKGENKDFSLDKNEGQGEKENKDILSNSDSAASSQYQILWGTKEDKKSQLADDEFEISEQPFLNEDLGLNSEKNNSETSETESDSVSHVWAKELEIKKEEPPAITPVPMPPLQDSIPELSSDKTDNSENEKLVTPPEETLADEFMKLEEAKNNASSNEISSAADEKSTENLSQETKESQDVTSEGEEKMSSQGTGETLPSASPNSANLTPNENSQESVREDSAPAMLPVPSSGEVHREVSSESAAEPSEKNGTSLTNPIEMKPENPVSTLTPYSDLEGEKASNRNVPSSLDASSSVDESVILTRPNESPGIGGTSFDSAQNSVSRQETSSKDLNAYGQLIPSSQPIPNDSAQSANYLESPVSSSKNQISPVGAALPHPSGSENSSTSSTSAQRPLTSENETAVRGETAQTLTLIKTYTVQNESWSEIVRKFQLTQAEETYYKNLNIHRMNSNGTFQPGTKIILPKH